MSIARLRRTLVHNAMDPNAVKQATVDLQLATAAALRERLDAYGGVILGDEVGAGKTFVTFAVLADTLLRDPQRGAVIFVPTDPLQRKWEQQAKDYFRAAVVDRDKGSDLASRVVVMDRSMHVDRGDGPKRPRKSEIVIAQHSTFSRQTSDWDRAACVHRWVDLRCPRERKPRSKFLDACGLAEYEAGWGSWARDDVLITSALAPLDHVFAEWDRGTRGTGELEWSMRQAVLDIRRNVGRRVLPDAAIAVIDEAHNLRSTTSQVYQSLMYVLKDRIDAMLFLTATPFQLGREELRNVVEFFRTTKASAEGSEAFESRLTQMDAGMNGYVSALDAFGSAWRDLDATEVDEAVHATAKSDFDLSGLSSARTRAAVTAFRETCIAKERLEDGLRPFVVRSVLERHRLEREGVEKIPDGSRIPVALVDRLITERLAEGGSTFIASALTSACSSWEALFSASLTSGDEPLPTLRSLRALEREHLLGPHPKTAATVAACCDALREQEKTLVFVERNETGKALREAISAQLGEHHDRSAYQRLQAPTRFGWPSLRENYLHTLYPDVFGKVPTAAECVRAVRDPRTRDLWNRVDVDGPLNYKLVKRVIEHAVFRSAAEKYPKWSEGLRDEVRVCVENLLEPDYVLNGLDLTSGESDERRAVPAAPTRTTDRAISADFVEAYASYASPWATGVEWLRQLGPDARAELIDAAAAAIATSHLQREVVQQEADGDAARHFKRMAELLDQPQWRERFEAIARQAADLVASNRSNAGERIGRLAEALRHSERVIFVNGDTANDTKERAINGFNTPLYPEILIATGVLAEGVDLHRACRRVIHHDLPWNPAKLEQRTGRVDRIGSLSSRLEEEHGRVDASAVDIGLPFVAGTYDETIFRRVLARRREFRCLLGNKPEWDGEDTGTTDSQAWSEGMVDALQARLGP